MDALIQAGAILGGSDEEGFVKLALKTALRAGNYTSIRIWGKAGLHLGPKTEQS